MSAFHRLEVYICLINFLSNHCAKVIIGKTGMFKHTYCDWLTYDSRPLLQKPKDLGFTPQVQGAPTDMCTVFAVSLCGGVCVSFRLIYVFLLLCKPSLQLCPSSRDVGAMFHKPMIQGGVL